MATQRIPIAVLVPSERSLEKAAVEKAKRMIDSTNVKPPRVVRIGDHFYVRDGNHRIMAAKQLGRDSVDCRVEDHEPKPNVADFDEDDCREAVALGYLGFEKVRVGSRQDKMKVYKDEDESLF